MANQLYQHLTAASYTESVSSRTPSELRAMRAECERMEAAISFARRALHGRLDIVDAEERRRVSGSEPGLDDLVESLPQILAETQPAAGGGSLRVLVGVDQAGVQKELMAEVDELSGVDALVHLPELSDDELRSLRNRLSELEHELSVARRSLHQRIDAVQAELSARYERGELNVDGLLT